MIAVNQWWCCLRSDGSSGNFGRCWQMVLFEWCKVNVKTVPDTRSGWAELTLRDWRMLCCLLVETAVAGRMIAVDVMALAGPIGV